MNYLNANENFLISISIKYLMMNILFVMLHLVMTKPYNGNLTPFFSQLH